MLPSCEASARPAALAAVLTTAHTDLPLSPGVFLPRFEPRCLGRLAPFDGQIGSPKGAVSTAVSDLLRGIRLAQSCPPAAPPLRMWGLWCCAMKSRCSTVRSTDLDFPDRTG